MSRKEIRLPGELQGHLRGGRPQRKVSYLSKRHAAPWTKESEEALEGAPTGRGAAADAELSAAASAQRAAHALCSILASLHLFDLKLFFIQHF